MSKDQYFKLLANYWYPLVHVDEIKSKPVARTILNQDIVIFLDEHNKPVAMKDQCVHRAAKLSLGKVDKGCIQCPYHGWEFNSKGQCKRIPQTLISSPQSKSKKSI